VPNNIGSSKRKFQCNKNILEKSCHLAINNMIEKKRKKDNLPRKHLRTNQPFIKFIRCIEGCRNGRHQKKKKGITQG
jgi:hypothetical protein